MHYLGLHIFHIFIQVLIAQKQQIHRSSLFVKRSANVYEAQTIR